MSAAVKQVELVPVVEKPVDAFVQMIERIAVNPDVDVAKLEKLLDMQERILRHSAEAAFNAAFSAMQAELPEVAERGKTDKTTYATLEDIILKVRPVLARHGFALSHETEWPDDKHVKVVGILTHREGHARRSVFLSGADATGSKNAIQALGSAMSYGRRYTTCDLLNIATRKQDDDASTAEAHKEPAEPEGLAALMEALQGAAVAGTPALMKAFNAATPDLRAYLTRYRRQAWEACKTVAAKVPAPKGGR